MTEIFTQRLQKYAEVIVRVGLNIQPGQRLVIGGAYTRGVDLSLAPLIRMIAVASYQAGASYVEVIWDDPALMVTRFQKAPRDSFDYYPAWQSRVITDHLEHGDAFLLIRADIPDLLQGQDPELIARMTHLAARHGKAVGGSRSRNVSNCCLVAGAVPAWAACVYPQQSPEQQLASLWEAIFSFCRVDQVDPVAAWEAHLQELRQRAGYLNARAFDAIHFQGPGTDLTIGLPACALWEAAAFKSESGIEYVANLPTEEVFTLPHRHRVDGTIHASRAISYGGNLIDDFTLVFEKGRVINAVAKKGEETLKSLLATDENSSRLGEVGLVPDSSPVSRSHALFYMSLIDENAACHLALGNARRFSMKDGTRMTAGQFKAAGGNQSSVHVDFMIGSGEMDVDGITREQAVIPLMRQGEWAFTI